VVGVVDLLEVVTEAVVAVGELGLDG
jgi:hypothetical protein